MARYANDARDQVRDAVDFVDLVSQRTELRRQSNGRYTGLCPFHDERSPSFGIEADEKLFYCFGCEEGGDVFSFVQKTEGVDFVSALELLADRYGVTLEREQEDPEAAAERARRERLLDLLERTATFYARYLWDSEEAAGARQYLADRGLGEEALRTYRVGYAPSRFDVVFKASVAAGFKAREAYDAGIVQRSKQGPVIDRFRRRIMFPLSDRRGRVLGFGARAAGADQQPKYLNSSDNAVYHKGRHLFGSDVARSEATRAGSVILAEGYTDVIALHQAGMRNVVGLMGTALTADQVAELSRLAPVVQLALDADGAGQKAMLRAAEVARSRRLELRVVPLPAGEDPADAVQARGADAVRGLVAASVPFVAFQVRKVLDDGDTDSAEGKDRVVAALRPIFDPARLPSSALREELQREVAERLALSPTLVAGWLAGGRGSAGPAGRRPEPGPQRVDVPAGVGAARSNGEQAERGFLAACLALPRAGREALGAVDLDETFATPLLRRAAVHLRAHIDDPAAGLGDEDDDLRRVIADLRLSAASEPTAADVDNARLALRIARLEEQMARSATADLGRQRQELRALQRAAMDARTE